MTDGKGRKQLCEREPIATAWFRRASVGGAVAEPLTVQIRTRNPLSVPIVLQQLRLLWRFLPDNGSPDNGAPDNGSPDNDGPPPQSISNETASKNVRRRPLSFVSRFPVCVYRTWTRIFMAHS